MSQALTVLNQDQDIQHIRMQAYNSLTSQEIISLMPQNYFDATPKNRAILTKIACIIIDTAYEKKLFTLDQQELNTLKSTYVNHVIASREAQVSAKRTIAQLLTPEEKLALQKHEYKTNKQQARETLTVLAERIYTKFILPNIDDEETLKVDTVNKELYINYFVEEKIKELDTLYQS